MDLYTDFETIRKKLIKVSSNKRGHHKKIAKKLGYTYQYTHFLRNPKQEVPDTLNNKQVMLNLIDEYDNLS